jgi:hypothetical protein
MKLNLICLAAASLSITLCSLLATAQDYEIRLEQPSKVGDKYSLSATGSQRVKVKFTSGDQVVRNVDDGFTLELTAEATVLTVDATSTAISKSFTIISSKLIKDGITKPLLPNGSIVLAKLQGGNTLFEMSGKPVEDVVAKALSTVIALHSGDSISDKAMFGTHEKKRVGESWNLNVEATMAFIKSLGGQARKEDIKGMSVFEKAENKHVIIRSSMDVTNVSLPLSAGYKAEKGEIHSEFFSKLPLPDSDGSVETTNKILMNLTGRRDPAPDKPAMEISLIYESSGTFRTIPTKQNSTL